MQPAVVDALLGVDDSEMDEDNTFFQMQQVFAHLLDSQLEHYIPERFWQTFKLWGNPVNIREQQDAFEFFSNLTDQLDSQLKKKGKIEVFQKTFSGMFTDQIICKDCPHHYERKEPFWSLQLNVKSSHTLQEALQQFVKGEVLEKDNAYFCEKCNEKRDATKRMCIKSLPESLVIHLKRFGYDWEEGRALKCNDHFSFPWAVDMAPYTADALGLAKDDEDAMDDETEAIESGSQEISATQPYHLDSGSQLVSQIIPIVYELVGIVVHSGQAHAGHYYSFIKDKRGPYMAFDPSNPSAGRWYRFSDTAVEEVEMNDTTLETECFGGQYKSKTYETSEPRFRSYSAYMLFYKAVSDTVDKEHIQPMSPLPHTGVDGLSQLTALVQSGERRGIFSDRMPVRIQRAVEEENLKFMQNRDVFNEDYFNFIKNLILVNLGYIADDPWGSLGVNSVKLAVHFLFHTYFHTQERLRKDVNGWSAALEKLLQGSAASCHWFIHYLGSEHGYQHIRPLLLECPNKEVRTAFASIVIKTLESHVKHGGSLENDCDSFLEHLLTMLEKDVPENWKTCAQYIWLVNSYAKLAPPKAARHLLSRSAFTRILCFLIGTTPAELGVDQPQPAGSVVSKD
jgi:ubiquitin carboxyl-terminal hydrolase 9/24